MAAQGNRRPPCRLGRHVGLVLFRPELGWLPSNSCHLLQGTYLSTKHLVETSHFQLPGVTVRSNEAPLQNKEAQLRIGCWRQILVASFFAICAAKDNSNQARISHNFLSLLGAMR